jgi:hypothetical protein
MVSHSIQYLLNPAHISISQAIFCCDVALFIAKGGDLIAPTS